MLTPKKGTLAVLQNSDFRIFLGARLFFTLAMQIHSVVVGWQVYEITKDPLSLGLIGLSEALPSLTVSLFAGHAADRFNKKKIILPGFSVLLLCMLALVMISDYHARTLNSDAVYMIYSVIVITGIARGFLFPALFSFWPLLLPKRLYANATVWNSTIWQTGAIAGPALGGLMYGFYNAKTSYTASAVLIWISLALLSLLPSKHLQRTAEKEDLLKSLSGGILFVLRHPVILGAMSLDLFAVLFGGAAALLPVFAAEILKTGPEGLGLLRSAPSIGALLMAGYLAVKPPEKNTGRLLFYSVGAYGLSMILFAVSRDFMLSLILLALSGAFDNVSVIIRSTVIQILTPDHMRGRVASVNSIFIGSSNEIGAFESGAAAKLMGTVNSVIFGGVMTLLIVAGISAGNRPLRSFSLKKYTV